jgi:hypothetical protein
MKWIALILTLYCLTSCASADRAVPAGTAVLIDNTPGSRSTRSVELVPTRTVERPAILPLVVTQPIETATLIEITPIPTLAVRSRPPATATVPQCPPLPALTEVKTQAAVQHFEHGLMFWLQERDEIWVLIATPTKDQFYWRVLPNTWSEGQPEVDPKVQPPAGRFQPRRGFGVAWRSGGGSYGPQRRDLGWAVDEELGFNTTLIYYPQGFYSPDCTWMPKSGIYELADERGTVYRFVGAGGIAQVVTGKE